MSSFSLRIIPSRLDEIPSNVKDLIMKCIYLPYCSKYSANIEAIKNTSTGIQYWWNIHLILEKIMMKYITIAETLAFHWKYWQWKAEYLFWNYWCNIGKMETHQYWANIACLYYNIFEDIPNIGEYINSINKIGSVTGNISKERQILVKYLALFWKHFQWNATITEILALH